ncbi:MAG: hypothetical protein BWY77_00343 [bacterium ADurb.Bin431]|nr:MAG: hypothetical protein BWY77_00343 [bacterium ADurb.Bin431]
MEAAAGANLKDARTTGRRGDIANNRFLRQPCRRANGEGFGDVHLVAAVVTVEPAAVGQLDDVTRGGGLDGGVEGVFAGSDLMNDGSDRSGRPAQIAHGFAVVGHGQHRRARQQGEIPGGSIGVEGIGVQHAGANGCGVIQLDRCDIEGIAVGDRRGAEELDRGGESAALVGKDRILHFDIGNSLGIENALVLAIGNRIKGAVVDPDHRIGVLDVEGFTADFGKGAVLQFEIFDFRGLIGAFAQDNGLVVGVAEDAVAEEDGVGCGEHVPAQQGLFGIVQPAILDLEDKVERVGRSGDILRADDVLDKGGAPFFRTTVEVQSLEV